MANANAIILIGNLVNEPITRDTSVGKVLCELELKVERESGNFDYIPVIVWGRDAEACKRYLTIGSLVHITGRIQSRNYSAEDGAKKVAIEVVASEIEFLSKKPEE